MACREGIEVKGTARLHSGSTTMPNLTYQDASVLNLLAQMGSAGLSSKDQNVQTLLKMLPNVIKPLGKTLVGERVKPSPQMAKLAKSIGSVYSEVHPAGADLR